MIKDYGCLKVIIIDLIKELAKNYHTLKINFNTLIILFKLLFFYKIKRFQTLYSYTS